MYERLKLRKKRDRYTGRMETEEGERKEGAEEEGRQRQRKKRDRDTGGRETDAGRSETETEEEERLRHNKRLRGKGDKDRRGRATETQREGI